MTICAQTMQKDEDLLIAVDQTRIAASASLNTAHKSKYSQYLTPATISTFMASMFPPIKSGNIKLLDPGAGIGCLTSAFLADISTRYPQFHIDVDTFELDLAMCCVLEKTLSLCEKTVKSPSTFKWAIHHCDFIEEITKNVSLQGGLWPQHMKLYTHCIMNPPYKKISSSSQHRHCLRSAGIETVNLYSAFAALALSTLEPAGHMVAIIPRSFCNGPYYRPFRDFILKNAAIHHIHLFNSRNKAFKNDKVLQENIIILLERNGKQTDVKITTSTDDSFSDFAEHIFPFNRIVNPKDPEHFIHIPTSKRRTAFDISPSLAYTLDDIGVQVSTGPVVDFRMKEYLKEMPDNETVPLLYPCHLSYQSTQWPKENTKKPNAIIYNENTAKWLYPVGFYTGVRRFSAKEEKRRVVAGIVNPATFKNAQMLGFENHLNIFHSNKRGLPETLARGLSIFLNSKIVDDYFRRFNGHTQINATDLKLLKYPSRERLCQLGVWATQQETLTQDIIDKKVESIAK